MKVILIYIMKTRLYRFIVNRVIPYVRFTTYYPKFKGFQFIKANTLFRPGDIILACDKRKLTGLLIPGPVDHAAFCVNKFWGIPSWDNGEAYEIAEMTHENYRKSMFFDLCKESDRIIIMRTDFDESYIKEMIKECRTFEHAVYDIDFELGVAALYCSELIYHADSMKKLQFDLSDIHGLGRQYLSPTGILTNKNLLCIYDSENEYTDLYGDQIERMFLK